MIFKKLILIFIFVIVMGRLPISMWNSLGENCQKNLLVAYAQEYLNSRDYCAAVKILTKTENNHLIIGAECIKVKI